MSQNTKLHDNRSFDRCAMIYPKGIFTQVSLISDRLLNGCWIISTILSKMNMWYIFLQDVCVVVVISMMLCIVDLCRSSSLCVMQTTSYIPVCWIAVLRQQVVYPGPRCAEHTKLSLPFHAFRGSRSVDRGVWQKLRMISKAHKPNYLDFSLIVDHESKITNLKFLSVVHADRNWDLALYWDHRSLIISMPPWKGIEIGLSTISHKWNGSQGYFFTIHPPSIIFNVAEA